MKALRIVILICFSFLLTGVRGQFTGQAHFDSVFTEYFRRTSGGWTAGDATISVPLSDHRVIWLFGDSYLVNVDTADNTLPCLFQIRNCMMVQDSIDRSAFVTVIDSLATGINQTTFKLPEYPEFQLLWPNHGFEWNDTVYIFLEHNDPETWELVDIYVAKLLMPGLEQVGMTQLPDMGEFNFGRCVLTDSIAGYRYIYGNKVNWIVHEPFVARCPLDGVFGPWEYWTGMGWSTNLSQIQKISELPVSPSYSVIQVDQKYYLITQENGYLTCGLGREIYSYESDSPTGPFVNETLLYTEESMYNERYLLTYNAFSHPEFNKNGELLISYNVNDWVDTLEPDICPSQCVNVWTDRMDADTYRPKFIRVPLGLITGTTMQQEPKDHWTISPNPSKVNQLVVLETASPPMKAQTFCMYDQMAGKVSEWEASSYPGEKITFSAPGIPGIYIIRSGDGRIAKRMVVTP